MFRNQQVADSNPSASSLEAARGRCTAIAANHDSVDTRQQAADSPVRESIEQADDMADALRGCYQVL
jgi:hypothetical protein